jgi:hypothetical protein
MRLIEVEWLRAVVGEGDDRFAFHPGAFHDVPLRKTQPTSQKLGEQRRKGGRLRRCGSLAVITQLD